MGMTKMQALRTFFENGEHGRKITVTELKATTQDERDELAAGCASALGTTLSN